MRKSMGHQGCGIGGHQGETMQRTKLRKVPSYSSLLTESRACQIRNRPGMRRHLLKRSGHHRQSLRPRRPMEIMMSPEMRSWTQRRIW